MVRCTFSPARAWRPAVGARLARTLAVISQQWCLELSSLHGTLIWYHSGMKRKHQKTLEAVFSRPLSGNIQWRDIEALFVELGAEISEREGSRVAVVLFGEVRVFHRPHPNPNTDKGALASIRKWLEQHEVSP